MQQLPALPPEQLARLRADIEAHGIRVPVELDAATGEILDGHHRQQIGTELGVDIPTVEVAGLVDSRERAAYAIRVNLNRRHLSPEQREELRKREMALAVELSSDHTQERIATLLGRPRETVRDWLSTSIGESAKASKRDHRRKVTRTEEDTIIEAVVAQGVPQTQVADEHEISQQRVSQIVRKRLRQAEREHTPALPNAAIPDAQGDNWSVLHGDFRKRLKELEPSSVDLIITDPPYPKEDLPLYGDLAKVAARLLGPRGRLFVYAGNLFLPEVMKLLGKHLTYGWTFCYLMEGGSDSRIMGRHLRQKWKPILAYTTGTWPSGEWRDDLLTDPGPEKQRYEWQQASGAPLAIIDQFSPKGGLVVDPFLGSGTFGLAALAAGRRFVGVELDEGRFEKGRKALGDL